MNASTQSEDDQLYCLDCGKSLAGQRYFVSPLQTHHCRRCTHPTRLERLMSDPRSRVIAVQVLVLLVAAWTLTFLLGTSQPH
jgi:uncharacterized paraquat-inducible protein A